MAPDRGTAAAATPPSSPPPPLSRLPAASSPRLRTADDALPRIQHPPPLTRHASVGLPRQLQHSLVSRPRAHPAPSSYPPPSREQRVTANPAHQVAESLRLLFVPTSSSSSLYESPVDLHDLMSEAMEIPMATQDMAARTDHALPANDGMNSLRSKLHEIRDLAISTEEKAQRMHTLMMEQYVAHHSGTASPISLGDTDARSLSDEPAPLDVGLAAMPIDPSNPYNLRPGDTEPSFSPLATLSMQDQELEESMEIEDQPALGCMHYLRNVKVQCFDCHRWFPCRHCHDQSHDLPFPHPLRRKMIRNMLCMLCQTPQPAGETCVNCGEYAAYYYCSECKLWDNDVNKSIYHCDDCGICRLGRGLGKDFVHCKKCNVCISISTSAEHPCVEGATEGDCPLCLEAMFASTARVVSLPCGHYMHAVCYKDLMGVTYKCPVCSRSTVNMELQWRKLDDEIRAQPMPDEDEELHGVLPHVEGHFEDGESVPQHPAPPRRPKVVWIGCNDCASRCWTAFHWLGLKCRICDSYNTNQMAPTAGYETEAERLIRQQQVHRQHDFTGNAVLRDAGIGAEQARRVDSALGVPSSPAQLAVPSSPSPGSPSSMASSSSPRRYFVQQEEPRRPSFTVPRFSTPTLPTLPNMNFPEMPRLPRMPNLPNMPNLPHMPNLPNMPNLPQIPQMPNLPDLAFPELGLPRFSPYDMFDSLSRSLSPMRYYLQGQDVRDEKVRRDANRSPTSVHSDPTADATDAKREGELSAGEDADADADGSEAWGSGDDGDEVGVVRRRGGRGGVPIVLDDEDDDDDEEEESDSDESDDGLSDVDMVDRDDLDMDLPGHR